MPTIAFFPLSSVSLGYVKPGRRPVKVPAIMTDVQLFGWQSLRKNAIRLTEGTPSAIIRLLAKTVKIQETYFEYLSTV